MQNMLALLWCFRRFLGQDIITIREAAWLTDNTYKYEDVVRAMGEITATLKGNLRVSSAYYVSGAYLQFLHNVCYVQVVWLPCFGRLVIQVVVVHRR